MPKDFFDTSLIKRGATILDTLDHPVRLSLLLLIHEKGRATVTELYTALKISQPEASRFLRTLRDTGIVITCREGKFIYYSINYSRIERIVQLIKDLLFKGLDTYTQRFETYAKEAVERMEGAETIKTLEDLPLWIAKFTKLLHIYQANLSAKANEILLEAKGNEQVNQGQLKKALVQKCNAAIQAFLDKYRP